MKIFFDTEFTGLHKNTTLISIGLVSENGKFFYAEFNDYDKTQVDDWIQKNVIDILIYSEPTNGEDEYYTMSRFEDNPIGNNIENSYSIQLRENSENISNELRRWLTQFDKIEWVSDVCHYDFVLLIDLVYGHALKIPYGIHNSACHDINQDIAKFYNINEIEAFDKSREQILDEFNIKIPGKKHNSLYDARIIKEIYSIFK